MNTVKRALSILLFAAVALISGIHGFLGLSFFSLLLLVVLCLSAWPLVRTLFHDQFSRLVFVFPVGYVIHTVLLSICGRLFGVHRSVLIVYLVVAVAVSIFFSSRKSSAEEIKTAGSDSDYLWLLLFLFVTVGIVAIPFLNVGALTADGFAYRAYFNADFFRNLAVTGTLSQSVIPPDNPYFGGVTLRYYWFFHLIPAFWQQLFPSYRSDFLFVQFSLAGLLMFVASLFAAVRNLTSSRKVLPLVLLLFAIGGSYEGIYVLQQLKLRQLPWTSFTEWNIDGILRWLWKAPQVDTLYRALLYAPQHLMVLSLFLASLLIWGSKGATLSSRARILFWFPVFATLGFSVFAGAVLIFGGGVLLLWRIAKDPRANWPELAVSFLLGIFFLLLYFPVFGMFQLQSKQVQFGPDSIILQHLFSYFLLNWGAILVFGLAGLIWHSGETPAGPLGFYLAICFFCILFVRLDLPGSSDVSLKMGHFSHVVLLVLSAGFLDRLLARFPKRWGWISFAVMVFVAPASITWMMDAYNSQDIKNNRFTTYVSPSDAEVYRWISRNLPARVLVQKFSLDDQTFLGGYVSEIPAFAARSMYLGDRNFSRIFQIPREDVDQRREIMNRIVKGESTQTIWEMARAVKIEYFFLSNRDPILKVSQNKLATPLFSIIMNEGDTFLFRVNNPEQAAQAKH